ncbi:MAG: HmuY family protein [Prevotellaceae bacterium]|nr:HmuY family protein [Prevotellaceae bacterium]
MKNKLFAILSGGFLLLQVSSCEGILENIYDTPSGITAVKEHRLVIDATSWGDWYYIDFDSLLMLAESKDTVALRKAQTSFLPYPVPKQAADATPDRKTGIYSYWFDVFGKGISVNEKRGFVPTAAQPEPASWSIAVHRNNVRTNGGAAIETQYTSFEELPANSAVFTGTDFREDEWSENEVWADESRMLSSIIGCQGIEINKVLSSWLRIEIPPMPPVFTLNRHVYVIRLRNGRHAAVQLENYMNEKGEKCWLTIKYKYPY